LAEGKSALLDKAADLSGKVVDALSGDPCILAMLIVICIAGFLIYQKDRSSERMEAMRLSQWKSLLNPKKENKNESD